MARMPPTGQAMASLHERSPLTVEMVAHGLVDPREYLTTLADAIAGLGLAPLAPDDEQRVREDLWAVVGRGLQEEARLQVAAVQKTVRRVARTLNAMTAGRRVSPQAIEQTEQTLRGRETGLREAHDTVAANQIVTALAGIASDWDNAEAMMAASRYLDHASEIAEACHIADQRLDHMVGNSGQPAIDWYAEFVRILKFIAKKNGIKPTVSSDPVTNKRKGRFLALATIVEQLLPLAMRSPTDEARAQRLKRALRHN
jgi:hypothetical protein